MKKITSLIISIVLTCGIFTTCSNQNAPDTGSNKDIVSITTKEQDIRETAFNQLTSNEKEIISGSWNEAKLSKIILKEGMGNLNDKSYMGKEVYLIDFSTKRSSEPNNMIVYLEMNNNKLIGYGYVD